MAIGIAPSAFPFLFVTGFQAEKAKKTKGGPADKRLLACYEKKNVLESDIAFMVLFYKIIMANV